MSTTGGPAEGQALSHLQIHLFLRLITREWQHCCSLTNEETEMQKKKKSPRVGAPVLLSGNEPDWYPQGCWFDPWSPSVG